MGGEGIYRYVSSPLIDFSVVFEINSFNNIAEEYFLKKVLKIFGIVKTRNYIRILKRELVLFNFKYISIGSKPFWDNLFNNVT